MPSSVVTDFKALGNTARAIRRDIVKLIAEGGSGHPGGSLSAVEILTALYFGGWMNYDPKNPQDPNRDRFILSKGHAAPVLYVTLAHAGFFPKESLKGLRKFGSKLQGHPDMHKVPGVEMSAGSLGQGISTAVGMALGNRMDGRNTKIYCMVGDGECQEGQVWEALMSAAHYELDNFVVIVDRNKLQIDGFVEDIMDLGDLPAKMKAFGFNTFEIDGHSYDEIYRALGEVGKIPGVPTAIVANTVKGKGVSFMENVCEWHGVAPKPDELERALAELADPA